jgi:hypothetical protein
MDGRLVEEERMVAHWMWTARVLVLAASIALSSGCGSGGGGGDNEPDPLPSSTPTATAARTATGAATPARTGTPTDGLTPPAATITPSIATPVPTATASGAIGTNARLTVTSRQALFGFQLTVTYPVAKGSFSGSANHVQCSTPSRELFVKNDHDDGTLELLLANAFPLAFPVIIDCTFDAGGGPGVSASELAITGKEVTDETGAVGDPATLTIAVEVS